jgi:recombination protein RecR
MEGVGPDDLNTRELMARVERGDVREVLLALGGSLEGDTTGFYLNRRLGEAGILVTTIARGISVGTDLDQADELTLGRSIADRKPFDLGTKRN